jgi:hypothetical protein
MQMSNERLFLQLRFQRQIPIRGTNMPQLGARLPMVASNKIPIRQKEEFAYSPANFPAIQGIKPPDRKRGGMFPCHRS